MDSIFGQITAILALTVGTAFVIRLLKQPLIVAYIFTGIICGPFLLNLLHGDQHLYEAFAQFGVVLLLFIIGLNLNLRHLRSIGRTSLVTGLGQVLFTAGIGLLLLLVIGSRIQSAAYLALAITFSSTIIIMKLLTDKHDTDTIYGRYTIGLMLVQDLIAVVLIIVLGMIGGEGEGSGWFRIGRLVVELGAVLAVLVAASKYVLPRLLARIADSRELLFLFAIAWCFGVASVLYWLGFSLEVGAILSGIALSSSPFQMEIASRVRPLRDFFLVLFFIVLGSELSLGALNQIILPAVLLSLFILIGNPLILYLLFRRMRFTRRNSLLAGLTAAQVSEFGFVLLFAGRNAGHVHGNEVGIFTAVAIITIFASSYLITYNEQIYRWLAPFFARFGPDQHRQAETPDQAYDAWVVGHHRIGENVTHTLEELGKSYAVIDFDPKIADRMALADKPFFFGDIADVEFLESLPLANSEIIIMTIPTADDQVNLIRHVRNQGSEALIIANAYHHAEADELYESGADFVMRPHLVGGQWIASILKSGQWNHQSFAALRAKVDGMSVN
jgi:Kef-type K+ transport system membrane component KefB